MYVWICGSDLLLISVFDAKSVLIVSSTARGLCPPNPLLSISLPLFLFTLAKNIGYLHNVVSKLCLINAPCCQLGPRPDWDPDIMEALENAEVSSEPDQQLEDDFVMLVRIY